MNEAEPNCDHILVTNATFVNEKQYSVNFMEQRKIYKITIWILLCSWIKTFILTCKSWTECHFDTINFDVNARTLNFFKINKVEEKKLNNNEITLPKSREDYNYYFELKEKKRKKLNMIKKLRELDQLCSLLDNCFSRLQKRKLENGFNSNKNMQDEENCSLDLCNFDGVSDMHDISLETETLEAVNNFTTSTIQKCITYIGYQTKSGDVVLTVIESKIINFFYSSDTFTFHFVLRWSVLVFRFLFRYHLLRHNDSTVTKFLCKLVTRVDLMELIFGIKEFIFECGNDMESIICTLYILLNPIKLVYWDIICVKMRKSTKKNFRVPTYMDFRTKQILTSIPESQWNNFRISIEENYSIQDNFIPIPESVSGPQIPDYDDPGVSDAILLNQQSYNRTYMISVFDLLTSDEEMYHELFEEDQAEFSEDILLNNDLDMMVHDYDANGVSNFSELVEESCERTNMDSVFHLIMSNEEIYYEFAELLEEDRVEYNENIRQ